MDVFVGTPRICDSILRSKVKVTEGRGRLLSEKLDGHWDGQYEVFLARCDFELSLS